MKIGAATAGHGNTSAAAAALLRSLPEEQLLARPWEAEAEEFDDPAWHRTAHDDDDDAEL